MATVTTASIIERAGILLDDMTHVGWTEDELELDDFVTSLVDTGRVRLAIG